MNEAFIAAGISLVANLVNILRDHTAGTATADEAQARWEAASAAYAEASAKWNTTQPPPSAD